MKKIHICLYFNGQEVININDVHAIRFFDTHIIIYCLYGEFCYSYSVFDKVEVDYYD